MKLTHELCRSLLVLACCSPALCTLSHAQSDDGTRAPHVPEAAPEIKTPWGRPIKDPADVHAKPGGARAASEAAATSQHASSRAARRAPSAIVRDHLTFATANDGALWVRGEKYKACFDGSGAAYIPFLGSRAPKNYPVKFHLESVSSGGAPIEFDHTVQPTRIADTIVFDRGSMREVYELALNSVEQKFVLESAPLRNASLPDASVGNAAPDCAALEGDLVLRMSVESELERSESSEGLEFSNELGSVRYGRATAIDAVGSRAQAATVHANGGIEVRVPQSFLATARFPVTIDPLVTSFPIDSADPILVSPDVAYDGSNDTFATVYELCFSATDHDVGGRVFDSDSTFLGGYDIDISSDFWSAPRIANNTHTQQFLVAAAVGTGPRVICGATVDAASLAVGPQFTISSTPGYDCFGPDVGGDPATSGPSYYFVVWERAYNASDHDIHAQLVAPNSTLVGSSVFLENSTAFDSAPSISKSDGHAPFLTQQWNIVWQRTITSSDHDIWGAQVHWNGGVTNAAFAIDADGDDDTGPTASSLLDAPSGTRSWLVAYTTNLGDYDVTGRLMNGTTTVNEQNLSALESTAGSGTFFQNQFSPDVDSDGTRFVLAYLESTDTFASYNIELATFTPVGSVLSLSEAHVLATMFSDFAYSDHPEVTTAYSGNGDIAHSMMIASTTDAPVSGQSYILGALYDAEDFTTHCWPGANGVSLCPCSNPPTAAGRGCNNSSSTGGAMLTETGTASLASDTVQFHTIGEKPTATSIVLQGTALANLAFGQGVRCVGGSLKRLYSKSASGGSITAPQGTDLTVSARSTLLGDVLSAGVTRYYLVYYRDPNVLGGCPSASTFNATQGGAITWRP